MQYGQIVFVLFILLLLYYIGMIVMDLQKARAAQAAELDNRNEEDIDISDEAETFKPVRIMRDEPHKQTAMPDAYPIAKEEEDLSTEEEEPTEDEDKAEEETEDKAIDEPTGTATSYADEEQPTSGYREAIMTDGIEVEKLLEAIDRLALDGTSELGAVIFSCENME